MYVLTINETFRLFINIILVYQLFYEPLVHLWLLLFSFTLKTLTLFVIVEINNKITTNKHLLGILDHINSTKLLNTTFSEHPDAVVITDTNKKIICLNPKAAKMTGYTEQEVIGQNPKMFSSNLTPRSTYQNLYASLATNQTWSGEFINKKKSGEIFIEQAKIVSIKDVNDKVIYYMAIKTDISKDKDYLKRLEYLSKHDDLTGLFRRGTFINLVEENLLTNLSVNKYFISIDIDNFKNINDLYGHMTGDDALILFSKTVSEIFIDNSYICRFGGDEFALYIYDKKIEEVNNLLDLLIEKLATTPIKSIKDDIFISISVGANMIDNSDSFNTIYEKSNLLLYEAKKTPGSSIKKDF